MKRTFTFILSLVLLSQVACASLTETFGDGTLRVDFVLAGNKSHQLAYLVELRKEPIWGGSKTGHLDEMGYGEYRFFVIDKNTNETIYSRGFCTLFEEWRTTEEAKKVSKAFYQTVTFPYPNNEVTFVLEERLRDGSFSELMRFDIDPDDTNIRKEATPSHEVVKIVDNGAPDKHLDLTFVAEGYTLEEMSKFKADVKQMADYILSMEPYNRLKHKINVWAVCSPSEDSGADNPLKDDWNRTALNTMFNTFYSERYLESTDVFAIRDAAACAPYDHICVLVNTEKYGGGGIYNHFSLGSADHRLAKEVMLHEIGHGLAGLADEYYTSDVAYQNFFNQKIEPWQPNITTLVDFEKKWKHMLDPSVPIPTPVEDKYEDVTGVFEGGGYVAKSVYRPVVDCRMKTNTAQGFCPVCQDAIAKMINFLTQ